MPQFRHRFLAATLVGFISATSAFGDQGDVRIAVIDRDGQPVPEVAVYLIPVESSPDDSRSTVSAELAITAHSHDAQIPTINQHDLSFSPHISIIQTGTAVAFPNDDEVRHHVYSFSPAKRLNMTIDSHSVHPDKPVFDQPGVVTIGCNIHDSMLAYILVVDTPYFGRTDGDGSATLTTLKGGEYEINVWTPRMSTKDLPAPEVITHIDGETLTVTYQFDEKLFPPHEHSETSLHWDDY